MSSISNQTGEEARARAACRIHAHIHSRHKYTWNAAPATRRPRRRRLAVCSGDDARPASESSGGGRDCKPDNTAAANNTKFRARGMQRLAALEQEDGDLAEVEVDEVARLVRHVRAEIAAHDAMPRRVVLLVKLLLDKRSNVLKNKICQSNL